MEAIQVSLTSKFRVTVPKRIREVLHLEKGNQIVFEILGDRTVLIRKFLPLDLQYFGVSATLTEWESKEDDKAYRDL